MHAMDQCEWDQARILNYMYAGCIEHTESRMFYTLAAAAGMLMYGVDATNAFGDAPPPKQGLHTLPDKVMQGWWVHSKGRNPILEGHVIQVLAAMQEHPEAP